MVSQPDRRRAELVPLKRAVALTLLALACSRHAEVEDLQDAGGLPATEVPRPDGGVPLVETADISESAPTACKDRESQPACAGTNDFGCNFDSWIQELTEACQERTDCHTDGWVEVLVGTEGCATELRMEDPDDAYVACIAAELGQYRCPCKGVLGSRFLGLSHDGCSVSGCGTAEFRCPPGESCRGDSCVPDASGGASGD